MLRVVTHVHSITVHGVVIETGLVCKNLVADSNFHTVPQTYSVYVLVVRIHCTCGGVLVSNYCQVGTGSTAVTSVPKERANRRVKGIF